MHVTDRHVTDRHVTDKQAIARRRVLAACLALCAPLASASPPALPDDQQIASQAIVMAFEKSLGEKLKAAMTSGGPVTAIDVCSQQAGAIAEVIGQQHGVVVRRITNKPRNPANAATPLEQAILAELAEQLVDNTQAPPELTTSHPTTRYYRAIQIKPLCLTCHGTAVSAEVTAALAQRYPHDQATGYSLGDLRGAFVVEWPQRSTDKTRLQDSD